MLASRLERGHLYVMDRASHHLQEERPEDYHRIVAAFLDQGGQT
jgi:pimeloyl-ACP methyl ester carboxylesterase